VERFEAEGVRIRVEGELVFVAWGDRIAIGRLRTRLGRPPGETPRQARTEALLRQWRQNRAGANAQPEAVVSDAILEAIAAAAPVTLEQLARVKGLGPGRLERYGDEILATVAEALADD
jgi:superfamily II DNA helicase RecQ